MNIFDKHYFWTNKQGTSVSLYAVLGKEYTSQMFHQDKNGVWSRSIKCLAPYGEHTFDDCEQITLAEYDDLQEKYNTLVFHTSDNVKVDEIDNAISKCEDEIHELKSQWQIKQEQLSELFDKRRELVNIDMSQYEGKFIRIKSSNDIEGWDYIKYDTYQDYGDSDIEIYGFYIQYYETNKAMKLGMNHKIYNKNLWVVEVISDEDFYKVAQDCYYTLIQASKNK